jgi:hypothetical protein
MFVDTMTSVDKEGLRQFVLSRLIELKRVADIVCLDHKEVWEHAQSVAPNILKKDERQVIDVLEQLKHLPGYITSWIETAVDSPERLDFFVLSKANELHSGDQKKDYFWALQIRHDQLVALVHVLELLLDKMNVWVWMEPSHLFDDPVFAGLTTCSIEQQVYLEAERIYHERQQLLTETH